MFDKYKKIGIALGVLTSLFLLSLTVFSFGPTVPAPGGDIPVPISAISETQWKEGSLTVGGLLELEGGIMSSHSEETRPTCEAATRGMLFMIHGEAGEKDRKFICYYDNGSYYWEQTAPDWRAEAATSIKTGLVGHWTFNEGHGSTAYDYSTNSNHGTLLHKAYASRIVAFTSVGSTSWTVPAGVTEVNVLVIGGGGGAGGKGGGGGGAGGLIFENGYSVTPDDDISITVGGGGAGGVGTNVGTNGNNSIFDEITVAGGGGGGHWVGVNLGTDGLAGGSGGGGGKDGGSGGLGNTPGTDPSQGNDGGNSEGGQAYAGGGGGGAGQVGGAGLASEVAGDGGDGLYFGYIFGEQYGEDGWFAGGGGGGTNSNQADDKYGKGGSGGGGDAGSNNHSPQNGTNNTGGGGGAGGFTSNTTGGAGGSGIVLIEYKVPMESMSETIVAFTSVGSTTWTVPAGVSEVDVLVVGGGGGAGVQYSGGGGAGGLIFESGYSVTPGESVPIAVGAGGLEENNGENSEFNTIIAIGGGHGATEGSGGSPASDGGSGGGASRDHTHGIAVDGGSQGNDGGPSQTQVASQRAAGSGGGGAGTSGIQAPDYDNGGDGGAGLYYGNIFGEEYGETGWFAGGGGGGIGSNSTGVPGSATHGGGSGAQGSANGENGIANTGGGGGGTGTGTGGSGGSGIVLIRYYKNPYQISNTTSPGQALEFDGVSDYVNVGSVGISTNGPATIAGWFYLNEQAMASESNKALHTKLYQHQANNFLYLGGTSVNFGSGSILTANNWHHIVLTYSGDSSTAKLYINFSTVRNPSGTVMDITGLSLQIGRIGSPLGYWNGLIDDVRIYNRALRPEEIRYIYETTYRD